MMSLNILEHFTLLIRFALLTSSFYGAIPKSKFSVISHVLCVYFVLFFFLTLAVYGSACSLVLSTPSQRAMYAHNIESFEMQMKKKKQQTNCFKLPCGVLSFLLFV